MDLKFVLILQVSLRQMLKSNPKTEQHERLKSRERRPEHDRPNGQWSQWSICLIGSMVDRLEG